MSGNVKITHEGGYDPALSAETRSLVDGIVRRAVDRAYNGALSLRRGEVLTRRHFATLEAYLRDEIILALRSKPTPAARRRRPIEGGR